MGKMVLHLLRSLDISKLQRNVSQEIDIIAINFVAVVKPLNFETHVSTDTTNIFIFLHISIHFEQRFSLGR
jgi:hypothetical protein